MVVDRIDVAIRKGERARTSVAKAARKFGGLPFRNAGYLLPNTPENRERLIGVGDGALEWEDMATRPRPGVDRVSSAWLLSRKIDNQPSFAFAHGSEAHPGAISFDMYGQNGFGHEGNHCTFETLCRSISIQDRKIAPIAENTHDADFEDRKYRRQEGHVINRISKGWANQQIDDHELLKRGMDLVEGFYVSMA